MWRVSDKRRFRGSSRLHRLLQLRVAEWLDSLGFDVYVEEPLEGGLVADVYAESPWGSLIVEVETGFVAPSKLELAEAYLAGKALVKAFKYSPHADIFAVALPSYIRLRLPPEVYKMGGEAFLRGPIAQMASLAGEVRGFKARIDAILEVSLYEKSITIHPLSKRGMLIA